MSRVTVVMAAYNAARTIEASIESILYQEFTEWDLVVVDDASTDGTEGVLRKYLSNDRIRIIRLHRNVGGARARTIGFESSSSEFIAIQDADDISLPSRLTLQLKQFDEDPDLSVVGGQLEEFGDWGGPARSYEWPTAPEAIRDRLQTGRSPVADCAAMIRRTAFESVGGYDPVLRRVYDLGLYLAMRDHKFSAVSETILQYRTVRPISFAYCISEGRFRHLAIKRHLHNVKSASESSILESLIVDFRSILVCFLRRWRERK